MTLGNCFATFSTADAWVKPMATMIVAPRRAALNTALEHGVRSGEIRADIDLDQVSELLVSPILARMAAGNIEDLEPARTSEQIVTLVFAGAARHIRHTRRRPAAP